MKRGRFQGVRQILTFHWKLYLVAALFAALAITLAPGFAWIAWIALPALFWLLVSIAVSHYVYDRSSLYSLCWLSECFPREPRTWVQLHAGLDETSGAIEALFPAARGEVFDIFDAAEMTEPSIAQARNAARVEARMADWRALPLATGACDAAFLIFTAHEFRRAPVRARFFREVARVLRGNGDLIVVEHLRDWANFLAFGPGFFHFLPERAWLAAAESGGFEIRRRFRVTPFVNVFTMRRRA
jgi:SAM-dependent methyltransferase